MATPDVHEEQLRNLLYRYWVKAGLALKYFKEGIEGFIDDCIKEQQRDILDEIRRQIGHPDASCDLCEVHEIRPHHKSSSCRFGKKCYCRDSRRIPCPNDVCGRIFDKIVEQHRYGSPSFRNTDATKWCSDHWEIAKCFLDKAGYAGKMSASDTDCKGLLSIITNNMFVQLRLDTPIEKDKSDIFSKNKSARNEILHQATLQVTEEQLTAYIDTMIEALEDKKLKEDARSKTAIQKLKQLKDRALSVSTFEEFEVRSEALTAIEEKRQEVLEIIEEKKLDAIDAIEEKKEVDRLTTQFNQLKESLDGVKGVQQELERQLADFKSSEKIRKLKDLVLEKRADFKTDLVAFYRQNHSTLPLAPLVKEYDAPILDFYVKPSFKLADLMVEENSGEKENNLVPFQSYQKIFFEETRQCRNIYITSPVGLGKTSFVKHLVMTWCHAHQQRKEDEKHFEEYRDDVELMKSFEFIFLLALRDAPEEDCEVDAMIQNQIMVDLANSHCYNENFLKEILAKETCLIILDGLDEWSHPVTKTVACRCQKNKSILRLIVRENCTVLTTTRPWKLTRAGISDASIDKHVEMTEMSVSSFDKLVDDVLSYMNARYNKNKQPKDFMDELLKTDLNNLEKIPLVLMQLLCLWFDGKPVGSSRCAIFANMLELLFSCVESTNAEIMERDRTDVATSKTIPRCFIGNRHCMGKYVLLRSLGAMSFDALFSDKENPHLVFDNDITLNYLSKSELQFCLKAGILTQSRSRARVATRQSKTWFIHKTYQEFLAALYISSSTEMAEKLSNQLFTVITSLQDIFDISFFFIFLYGFCPDDICVGISKRIESIVERTEDFQQHRTSLRSTYELSYRQLPQVVLCSVYFLVECASERKDNNSHLGIIPLKDFFLLEDVRLMDTVTEIIRSKRYCIKSIFWVTQAFLDSIDVNNIHSVQNIALSDDVSADNVRTIISKSLDTINAIEMPASCLGVAFDMLMKAVHLQALHLYRAELSHGDLSQLYSWISQSTTLKQIMLSNIVCRDHRSSSGSSCRDLLLDLSAHEHLEFLQLEWLEVEELRICRASLKICILDGLKESNTSVFIDNLPYENFRLPANVVAKHFGHFPIKLVFSYNKYKLT